MSNVLRYSLFIWSLVCSLVSFAGNSVGASDPQSFIRSFDELLTAKVQGSISSESSSANEAVKITAHALQAKLLKKVFIDIIAVIDNAMIYWQEQKCSPYSYLIYKGPQAWLKGLNNSEEEVNLTIATLKRYQDHYAELLGKVSLLLQRADLEQLVGKHVVRPEEVKWIELYKKAAMNTLEQVKAPSHFKKYWVRYAAAGIGLTALALYGYIKQDKIDKYCTDGIEYVNKFYKDHVEKPLKDLNDLIKREDSTNDKNKNSQQEKANSQTKQKIINKLKNLSEVEKKQAEELVRKVLPDIDKNLSQEETDKIVKTLLSGNVELLSSKLKELIAYPRYNSAVIIQIVLAQLQTKQSFVAALLHDLVEDLLGDWSNINNKLNQILKDSRLNFIVWSMIPTALVTYGGYKGFKYLFKQGTKDFQPVRKTLADMHRILNKYIENSSAMTDIDEGLYAYFAHKLTVQTSSLLDLKDVDEFMKDVHDLTVLFSARQRIAVIDRMYRTHTFLSVAGVK